MRKMLKQLVFTLLFTAAFFGMDNNSIVLNADTTDLDTHLDDPVAGKMSEDDFSNPEDWAAYVMEHPEEGIMLLDDGYPNDHIHANAELAYRFANLPNNRAIQNFYIEGEYIYVTQRKSRNGYVSDTYLSRCKINPETNTATCEDSMLLQDFGHGQTLECYTYNDKTYFLVTCKANTAYENAWGLQVGRIEYVPDGTIRSYTDISRFSVLAYANQNGEYFGDAKRVDAAISTDESKLFLWIQNTSNDVQYSIYRMDVLNRFLDVVDIMDSKYVSFEGNDVLQRACLASFSQSGIERVLPNGSNQGVDLDDEGSIYIAGGNVGELPQIAVMKNVGGTYEYSQLITFINEDFDDETEIEGVKLTHTGIYFGVADQSSKKYQYIYYLPYENIGQNAVHSETVIKNAKEPTCEETGYTGDTHCSGCDELLKEGEVIPAKGHAYDAGVVTVEPQAGIPGNLLYTCTVCQKAMNQEIPATGIAPKKGYIFEKSGVIYKVTKKAANKKLTGGEVEYVGRTTKKTTVSVPKTVKDQGVTYKVTSIGKEAFKKDTKLKKITISANVKKIGKHAFYGCKKLKTIVIKTTKLTSSKVGSNAFKGIHSSAKINVINSKVASYKKLLKKKGIASSVKVY